MAKETLNLEVKSNIKSVTQDTDQMATSLGDVNTEAKEGIGNFTMMGVSLNGVKAAFGKIIPMAKAMFGSIKAGLISTGIGAFIVAIGSLVSYFTNTKEGSEQLRRILDGLGAGMNVLTDVVSKLGEGIVNAFSNPKQALIDLWDAIKKNLLNRLTGIIDGFQAVGKVIKGVFTMDWDSVREGAEDYGKALIQVATGYDTEQQMKFLKGVRDINKEFKSAIMMQMALTNATQKLKDEEREFIKARAKTRQIIQKSRLEALDETKTQEERLAALKKANDLEISTTNKAIAMQKTRIAVKKQENALSKSLEEDLDALAALEVELIDLKTQSFQTQKRLATEMETLTNELNARTKQEAKDKIEQEEQDKLALENFTEWKIARIEGETNAEFKIRINAAKELAKELAVQKKKDDEDLLKAEEATEKAKEKIRAANLSNISAGLSLVKSLAGENKEIMAGVIIAENALGIARTIISTQASNATAIAEGAALSIPTFGASVVAASGLVVANNIAAGISIAASVAAAGQGLSALGKGGATGGGAPAGASGGGGGGTPAPQMMSGSFELGGGQEIEPVQAYVVSDEITDSQNALEIIRRRATI
jgi:hypothetical protein